MAGNVFSMKDTYGAGIKDRQAREINAMNMAGKQQQMGYQAEAHDKKNRQETGDWLVAVSGFLQDEYTKDPSSIHRHMPQMAQEFQSRTQKPFPIDPQQFQSMSPEEIQQGFGEMLNFGVSLGGQQRMQDVASEDLPGGQYDPNSGEKNRVGYQSQSGASRFYDRLTEGLSVEDQDTARRVELGLVSRAGTTSSTERIANDSDLTGRVADSRAAITGAESFAKAEGASRNKYIDAGFESIKRTHGNIRNIDRAVDAIDQGASTGVIESRFFPSFRESTLKLEQIRNELGLDVIGGVTFGALSKGELDLALETALPTGLEPPELKAWLLGKKAAQEKLLSYYGEQVEFLDQGGTVAGFLRSKQREQGDKEAQLQQAREAIAAGTPPENVHKKLRDNGIDPSNL